MTDQEERSGPHHRDRPDTNSRTTLDAVVLYVGPVVSESAPAIVREGLVRRRLCWTASGCPCGARAVQPNRAARRAMKRDGGTWEVTIVHSRDCPAIAPETTAWVRRWSA